MGLRMLVGERGQLSKVEDGDCNWVLSYCGG